MKKLDRYIIGKFLGTFVFIMVLLLSITVVIDLSEKIDNFMENNATFGMVATGYYIYFLPHISSLIGPFFVLVAVIFFTSQLAERSEIIAILNSGTSFNRLLLPYMIGASILAGIFYLGNNFIVPFSNSKRLQFEKKYVFKPYEGMRYSFHRTVAPGTIIYMENYLPGSSSGFKFSIDHFEKGRLTYKLRSDKIEWLDKKQKWRISDYYTRTFQNGKQVIAHGAQLDTSFNFTPADFTFTQQNKDEMTTPQLKGYIDYMYASGQPFVEFYEVELYRRTSSAFSIYILTLIGVSLASKKMRGGLGWHLVLGIGLSAVYEIVMKFSVTFATNSSLPALIAVWIPNVIFAVLAVYLLRKAPK